LFVLVSSVVFLFMVTCADDALSSVVHARYRIISCRMCFSTHWAVNVSKTCQTYPSCGSRIMTSCGCQSAWSRCVWQSVRRSTAWHAWWKDQHSSGC